MSYAKPSPVAATVPAPGNPRYIDRLAASIEPTRTVEYKRIAGRPLELHLFQPDAWQVGDRRPCLVAFHGGGWTSGTPRSMYPIAAWAAELGLVGVSVQYRLHEPGAATTVFECVKDARSALRYLRQHATQLGIDPERIAACGASAGGHLAAATVLFEIEERGEDSTVPTVSNALILFTPVIDTSAEGYGMAKIGPRWRDLSPLHQIRRGMPPTLLFHGTSDATTPFIGASAFHERALRLGNRIQFHVAEGAQHTYMLKDPVRYAETLEQTFRFLRANGFLPEDGPFPEQPGPDAG